MSSVTLRLVAVATACCVALAPAHAQKRQRDLVTRDEIQASAQRDGDLHTALRSLRPRFLEPPTGTRSLGNAMQVPTAVVVDGRLMGGLETLQSISAASVAEVRYLEPSKAGTEYGSNAQGGAVVVKLYREPKEKSPPKTDSTPPARPR